jgi:glyoxylase-like metal-dependent hydrolase (beta-lactamase superfamily II)
MNITGTLQHQAWSAGQVPPVERVRAGLWSVPVPIPRSPLRYTLVYAIELAHGIALVDAGWAADDSWQGLLDGLKQTGHDIDEVRTVLVTHAHMDHLGLAGRVRERSGAAIGMHPAEAAILAGAAGSPDRDDRIAEWLRARGASTVDADRLTEQLAAWRDVYLDLARPDLLVEDGDRPLGPATSILARWTPGHTPGHLCFVDERRDLLSTGDHLLPRISPNISVPPGRDGEPLGDFLASLSMMDAYRTAEALPAHEYRFTGIVTRRDALADHHRARLAEAEAVVHTVPGVTTWEVARGLRWSRPWEQFDAMMRQSAVGEAYSHLLHLAAWRRIANVGAPVDAWHAVT